MLLFQYTHTSGRSHLPACTFFTATDSYFSLGRLLQHFTSSNPLFLGTHTTFFTAALAMSGFIESTSAVGPELGKALK